MSQIKVPIKGMHCQSCETLIGDELRSIPGVTKAKVSLRTQKATIYSARLLSGSEIEKAVKAAGYSVGYEQKPLLSKDARVYKDLLIGLLAVIIVTILISIFDLQNLVNVNTGNTSAGVMALVVGLTAGFSTCMALIGGLVLGISASHAEKHPTSTSIQKFRPHLMFNFGRIVSFTLLGGFIGLIGATFQMQGTWLGLLTIAVGVVMLLLGLKLTDLFPRLKSFALPSKIGRLVGIKERSSREYSHTRAFVLGGLTFFLPCGFTQAMQLFAVSTGDALTGALVMGAFAIGTAPGLLGIGGLTSVAKGVFAKRFFRVVGVAVVAMALVNFSTGFNQMGLSNIFSGVSNFFSQSGSTGAGGATVLLQTTYTLSSDIVPSTFTAKVGQPTTLEVDVKDNGQGCMSTIMIPGLYDKPLYLQKGKKLRLTFTPKMSGTYKITCAMGIPRGSIKVEA